MKINIHAKLKNGAWGGGNQFLKALAGEFERVGVWAEEKNSDVVLFNGYQDLIAIMRHFIFHKKQKNVYRLGPILSLHRSGFRWILIDTLVVMFANIFPNLVVFQSKWSHDQAVRFGLSKNKKFSILGNSVDSNIFNKKEFKEKIPGEKIKLVYTSWSSNMKKGFKYLKFLDENLDFSRYEFTFIGNSPFEFKNIKSLKPLPSGELGEKIRESDIFVSPVEDDACSNALIEGLASGLPAVALNSGGNSEIVANGGELFDSNQVLLTQIDKVAENLKSYYDAIRVKTIDEIAGEYVKAIESL